MKKQGTEGKKKKKEKENKKKILCETLFSLPDTANVFYKSISCDRFVRATKKSKSVK